MTRKSLALGVIVAGLGVSGGSSLAHTVAAPALRVVRLSPLTIQGAHFKGAERVTVTLLAPKRASATIVAGASGTFTVAFRGVRSGKCAYSARARGARGSAATLKATTKPACRPKAQVEFGSSVVVKGSNFRPSERVTITIAGNETWTAHAVASARGTFAADLGAIALSDCDGYTLRVTGSKGSRFALRHDQAPC
jgi:hypothetical protein